MLHMYARLIPFGALFSIAILVLINASSSLWPFVTSLVLAYILSPLVAFLQRKTKLSRSITSAFVTLFFTSFIFLLVLTFVPFVMSRITSSVKTIDIAYFSVTLPNQIRSMIRSYIPETSEATIVFLQNIFTNLLHSISSSIQKFGLSFGESLVTLFSNAFTILFVPIITFFFMKDWYRIISSIHNILPKRYVDSVSSIVSEIDAGISLYLLGQVKTSVVLSILYGSLLSFTPVKMGFLWGCVLGMCTVIPYLGFLACSTIILFISAKEFGFQGSELPTVGFALFIGQIVDAMLITPRIIGDSIKVSPPWIIFGVIVFGYTFGFAGAIFSIPLIVICSVLLRRSISLYQSTSFYQSAK